MTLAVYDLTGRRISMLVDQVLAPGMYEMVWQADTDTGTSVASGLFVYRLTVGAHSVSRAMSLLR